MTAQTEERDGSDGGPLAFAIAVIVLVVWVGLPTLLFGLAWAVALAVIDAAVVSLPLEPVGVAAAIPGLPDRTMGVPTLYATVSAFLTTLAWFALVGGGSEAFQDLRYRGSGFMDDW